MRDFAEKETYELVHLSGCVADTIIFISYYVVPLSVLRLPLLCDGDSFTVLFCMGISLDHAFLLYPFCLQGMPQQKRAQVTPVLKPMRLLVEGVK